MGLRLPIERIKIELAMLVEGNPFIFEQGALQRRAHSVARADTPLGVDYSVPGQVLRASLECISNPSCPDAGISRKIDACRWRNQGSDSTVGHHSPFRYLLHNVEDRFPVCLPIFGLIVGGNQVPQSRM